MNKTIKIESEVELENLLRREIERLRSGIERMEK